MRELTQQQVEACRRQFPALARRVGDHPAIFFDGPAGTQVPQRVIDAISQYFIKHNANHGGAFATSRESDLCIGQAHQAVADLLGADDPACIAFGQNMTSLTFALSRSLARQWSRGDEVVVTRLDHDANVSPWVMAAEGVGATVRYVDLHQEDATLDLEDLRRKLSDRTQLVAVGCASNATGGIQPVGDICRWVHEAGGLVFLDAVHFAPHSRIDVNALDCDFLACSAYKFFGPHVGIMWGRRELLERLTAYKVRPAPDSLPGKWMSGTQNHEGIAGVLAAIDYIADVGREVAGDVSLDRRSALDAAYEAIGAYERQLVQELISGLLKNRDVKVWGITDPSRASERLPTLSITHRRRSPEELANELGQHGIFVWHGNYYALNLTETLGLEPEGMVRTGLAHYNTREEVQRFLDVLGEL
jgi:cysteine desulfurase family protein (TIGR01976 family)